MHKITQTTILFGITSRIKLLSEIAFSKKKKKKAPNFQASNKIQFLAYFKSKKLKKKKFAF